MSGWNQLTRTEVPERRLVAIEFEHVRTGARVLKLSSADDNKVFVCAVRTPSRDDCGAAHILEHSVLAGSRDFPTREPFVDLLKSSLASYINASTFPDRTLFELATRCDPDFHNIVRVYLDAVFHPRVLECEQIFRQEAWRVRCTDEGGHKELAGVVFSEMKGGFAMTDSLLEAATLRALFPDTPYGKMEGGDPRSIPELTYDQLISFHRSFYHPNNVMIVFSGNGDVDQELGLVDAAIRDFPGRSDSSVRSSIIPIQAPISGPVRVSAEYPVDEEDDDDEEEEEEEEEAAGKKRKEGGEGEGGPKKHVAMSWVFMAGVDVETSFTARSVVNFLLKEGSKLRTAILGAGIAESIEVVLHRNLLQPYISIQGRGVGDPTRFEQAVIGALEEIVRGGISAPELAGISPVNSLEFGLRHDFEEPIGMDRAEEALRSWTYDKGFLAFLQWRRALDGVKQSAARGGHFEAFIRDRMLENKHSSVVVLEPSKEMAKRQADLEESQISRYCAEKGEEPVRVESSAMEKWLTREDTPTDSAKIPRVTLRDVPRKADSFEMVEARPGIKVLTAETNGIAEVAVLFDATAIPPEELSVVVSLLSRLPTRRHSLSELATLTEISTGGISFSLGVHRKRYSQDFVPVVKAFGLALVEHVPELIGLIAEILCETKWDDHARILEVIREDRSEMKERIVGSGEDYATLRACARMTAAGAYEEVTQGISFFKVLERLIAGFDGRAISGKLADIAAAAFNQSRVSFAVCAEGEHARSIVDRLEPELKSKLPATCPPLGGAPEVKPMAGWKDEAVVLPVSVNCIAVAWKVEAEFTGVAEVVRKISEFDYEWPTLRVHGGAYGAEHKIGRDGVTVALTFSDPRLKDSVRDLSPASHGKFFSEKGVPGTTELLTKFIVSAAGERNPPKTPSQRFDHAIDLMLSGLSQVDLQREYDQLLSSTPALVKDVSATLYPLKEIQLFICALVGEASLTGIDPSMFPTVTHLW